MAEQLQKAMESRAVIEQAKGILMRAENCGPDAAFGILVKASQHRNQKLREIRGRDRADVHPGTAAAREDEGGPAAQG